MVSHDLNILQQMLQVFYKLLELGCVMWKVSVFGVFLVRIFLRSD